MAPRTLASAAYSSVAAAPRPSGAFVVFAPPLIFLLRGFPPSPRGRSRLLRAPPWPRADPSSAPRSEGSDSGSDSEEEEESPKAAVSCAARAHRANATLFVASQ